MIQTYAPTDFKMSIGEALTKEKAVEIIKFAKSGITVGGEKVELENVYVNPSVKSKELDFELKGIAHEYDEMCPINTIYIKPRYK